MPATSLETLEILKVSLKSAKQANASSPAVSAASSMASDKPALTARIRRGTWCERRRTRSGAATNTASADDPDRYADQVAR